MRQLFTFFLTFLFCTGCASYEIKTGDLPVPRVPANDPALVPASRTTRWWVLRHNGKILDNVIKDQKIVFIGDSITQGYEYDGLAAWEALNKEYGNKITNLGFSADSTEHVIWRLENGEFPEGINPDYVVLMIGTNNKGAPESTAAGIGKIVRIINSRSPESRILLFSILPRGEGMDDPDTKKNNEINKLIQKYDGYLNIRYIDIVPYYVTKKGELREELFARDKLHLSAKGYDIWKDRIIAAIRKWNRVPRITARETIE